MDGVLINQDANRPTHYDVAVAGKETGTLSAAIRRTLRVAPDLESLRACVQNWVREHAQFPCRTYLEEGMVVATYFNGETGRPERVEVSTK